MHRVSDTILDPGEKEMCKNSASLFREFTDWRAVGGDTRNNKLLPSSKLSSGFTFCHRSLLFPYHFHPPRSVLEAPCTDGRHGHYWRAGRDGHRLWSRAILSCVPSLPLIPSVTLAKPLNPVGSLSYLLSTTSLGSYESQMLRTVQARIKCSVN